MQELEPSEQHKNLCPEPMMHKWDATIATLVSRTWNGTKVSTSAPGLNLGSLLVVL
jgi:hypothetical protein